MADGWIVLLVSFGMVCVVLVTALITGAWERVQKYRADKKYQ